MPAYPHFEPSACSVARTLDVLGDTWSILVLRDVLLGAHRFDQIQAHPPRFEYHLTRKGLDLQPVLIG